MVDRYFSPGSKKTPEPSMRVKRDKYAGNVGILKKIFASKNKIEKILKIK